MTHGKAARRPRFLGEIRVAPVSPAHFRRIGDEAAPPPSPAPSLSATSETPMKAVPVEARTGLDARVVQAIEAFRAKSEQLAEQARSDALEIGLLVARRILETELRTDIEPLFAFIRSAIRRAGESRKVRVHLCPEDLERVKSQGDQLSMAEVELVGDAELTLGDCLVDTDWGTVDGRLDARLAEVGKALHTSLVGGRG